MTHTRTYCGADEYLKGELAMVYAVVGTSKVVAQFHNFHLRQGKTRWGSGWHTFDAIDFTEDTTNDTQD